MNGTIEAKFFPEAAEPLKKPCILIIDNNRDFTYSAKRALDTTGHYLVCEENDPSKAHQTAQNIKPDLILLDSRCRKRMAGKSRPAFNPIRHCIEYQLSF